MEWLGIGIVGWALIAGAAFGMLRADWQATDVMQRFRRTDSLDEEEARERGTLMATASLTAIRIYLSTICWLLALLIVAVVIR